MSWLSAAEAADIMRCSEQTLIKMAKEGQFPTAKWAGKKVRIHESDLRPEPADTKTKYEHLASDPAVLRLVTEIESRLRELRELVESEPPMPLSLFSRAS